jgi:hypothetical protein
MEPQQQMLEALGINGMSSDEEETVSNGIQYQIRPPRWRAPMVTPWLRMFDSIYIYHRTENNDGDRRGSMPRRQVSTTVESTSRKFVSGLPINAYKIEWLEEQLDLVNVVHPTSPIDYEHDPDLAQCVLLAFYLPFATDYLRPLRLARRVGLP